MRKPKDFDAELKALNDRARELSLRKLQQLGKLVVATGADTLQVDVLAGALLSAAEAKDGAREGWRVRGATFFQRTKRKQTSSVASAISVPEDGGGTQPLIGGASTK
jgi:hypothetical protein